MTDLPVAPRSRRSLRTLWDSGVKYKQKQTGFTIVELLIVIVVVAILATISIVAYNGIQARARDTMRTDGIAKIERALELYRVDNG